MPTTLNDRITKAKEKVAKLEHQQRVEEKNEREAKRKKDARRNYIIGELVAKYFPDEILRFEPHRAKAENTIEFEPFEIFLSALAADQELIKRLKEEARRNCDV